MRNKPTCVLKGVTSELYKGQDEAAKQHLFGRKPKVYQYNRTTGHVYQVYLHSATADTHTDATHSRGSFPVTTEPAELVLQYEVWS